MKKLVEFSVLGFDVVPWSVPDIGTATGKNGKRHRFARRSKKTVAHLGKLSYEAWVGHVKAKAREAWPDRVPVATPIRLHIEFISTTPPGHRHGELWVIEVAENEKGEWTKRGRSSPDLTNCFKGTEDAIQGVLYHNDAQSRVISSIALYGPMPGIKVVAHEIEPGDFPGHGETVR